MISASLNRCKGVENQVVDFLKQLAAKLELVLLISLRSKSVIHSLNAALKSNSLNAALKSS